MKKGDIFYKCWINVESDLKEKSTVEFEEWHITQINAGGIYLKVKNSSTWGKLSKRNGDFGWLKLSAWAKGHYHKHFAKEEQLKAQYSCSKAAAYRSILMEARKYKKDSTRILNQVEKAIKMNTKKIKS